MDIQWALANIPNYDMTDLRKSKELAFNQQAELADMIEKTIRERRDQLEITPDEVFKTMGPSIAKMFGSGMGV